MKPNYKNWMPKGSIISAFIVTAVSLILLAVFTFTGLLKPGALKTILLIIFTVISIAAAAVGIWMLTMYRAFSYDGKKQLSKKIIEGVADYVIIPEGGKCLDVGCGSGALTIECAKRNPRAQLIGTDRWGKEYSSYSKKLCEENAKAERVNNIIFLRGDATALDYPDETFDAVTSNYVYHNIPSLNRQDILMETLRTLKKGGCFAIHDIFSVSKYGNMDDFISKLKKQGYEKVELIDTTDGMFMDKKDAQLMALSGSALLTGIK